MQPSKVLQLITRDEGYKLDFKLKLSLELESEKREFVKDTIAIANTQGGRGYILFGIEDKTKKIVGIQPIGEGTEERMQQMIASRTMPPIPVNFDIIQVKGKKVGVLTIFKSRQKPHQMRSNGAFYVRRGSTTDVATRYEIAAMLQEGGLLSFERVPCREASLDDLELAMMRRYVSQNQAEEVNLRLLEALGIIEADEHKGYYPTYGGLLIMGKNPSLYMPQACIEVCVKEKREIITGNIIMMLEQFNRMIRNYLSEDYPYEALEEIVANAVIHRDYWNTFYYTQVHIGETCIIVENPGNYPLGIQEERQGRNNAWLYSRLQLLQEPHKPMHLGIGIEKVKKLLRQYGEVQIEVNKDKGLFRVRLPGGLKR